MSEKAPTVRNGVLGLRLGATVPFVLSIVAFVLTLLTVIAGSSPGMLQNTYSMTLNTTHLGQDIVRFTPTSTNGGSSSSDPFGGFFTGILDNITQSIDGTLGDAEAALVGGAISALGISQYYTFHLTKICEGNLSSDTDPDAKFTANSCSSYTDSTKGLAKFGDLIPSSTTIGTTNISVPILETVGSAGGYLNDIAKVISGATLAFFIISLIGTGLQVPTSIVSLLFPSSSLFLYINLGLSNMAMIFQLVGAIIVSALAGGASTVINKIGDGVGLQSSVGGSFLAFVWVSFVLIQISAFYWTAIWFVEFRKRSYKARRRSPTEMGNYKGIGREVLSDLRLPKNNAVGMTTQMETGLVDPGRRNSYNVL